MRELHVLNKSFKIFSQTPAQSVSLFTFSPKFLEFNNHHCLGKSYAMATNRLPRGSKALIKTLNKLHYHLVLEHP